MGSSGGNNSSHLFFFSFTKLRLLAGKTTLLNVLAGRAKGNIEGKILLNGHSRNEAKPLLKHAAYIMQDDVLLANQTPREILHFSAAMRIPRQYSKEERDKRVEELINELNLNNSQNTRVGAPGLKRGISGGKNFLRIFKVFFF